jgi:hypothetical protein
LFCFFRAWRTQAQDMVAAYSAVCFFNGLWGAGFLDCFLGCFRFFVFLVFSVFPHPTPLRCPLPPAQADRRSLEWVTMRALPPITGQQRRWWLVRAGAGPGVAPGVGAAPTASQSAAPAAPPTTQTTAPQERARKMLLISCML